MRTLTKEEFMLNKFGFFKSIVDGALFIHPTDTIYGMGCDATNEYAVKKLRSIKEQESRPFSVIAPDIDWVKKNCDIPKNASQWLKKLPGPYTLILPLKNKACISKTVNLGGNTLGIRMIDHWMQGFVQELGRPIVTTSANKVGKIYMTSTDDLDPKIAQGINFMIYEGEKQGKASNIVDFSKDEPSVKER